MVFHKAVDVEVFYEIWSAKCKIFLHLQMPCCIAGLILVSEPFVSQEREAGQMRIVVAFWSFKVHILKFVAVPCCST